MSWCGAGWGGRTGGGGQSTLLANGMTWEDYPSNEATEVIALQGLSDGYQYRVERYTFPPNLTQPDIDWTIVVVVDVHTFAPDYIVDYLIGLPVLALCLAVISILAAVLLIGSLTRPLRRIAEQLNAVAQLKLRANRRHHRGLANTNSPAVPGADGRPRPTILDELDSTTSHGDAINAHATVPGNAGSWLGRFVRSWPRGGLAAAALSGKGPCGGHGDPGRPPDVVFLLLLLFGGWGVENGSCALWGPRTF